MIFDRRSLKIFEMSRTLWLTRAGLTVLTTLSAGALAAPAQAASTGLATVTGTTVQYKAPKNTQNTVVLTRNGRTITVDDRVPIKPGKGCAAVKGDKTKVRCTTKKNPTWVEVYTYDRKDSVVDNAGVGMAADGGSGKNTLVGSPYADVLDGGEGNDKIWGNGGDDYIHGRGGDDYLSGGDGNDNIDGDNGNDTLHGGPGYDQLFGEAGNDKEYGEDDGDMLEETFDPSGPDADYFSGGNGEDTVLYLSRSKPVFADPDGVKGDDGSAGEHDTIATNVEDLYGGDGADWLSGTPGRNVIFGEGGDDIIYGFAGDDFLEGGNVVGAVRGKDKVNGGPGKDHCGTGKGGKLTACEESM
jgi:serralysin